MALGSNRRGGVVLLVVISLLMLFAIVGIAFVIYAEAQASTARIWKESEGQRRPDIDPEELLSYFLSQLIYDTDNPHSALRGHSLARTMYGQVGNTIPFNGVGRIHTPGDDDYFNINYTQFGGGAPPDPNQYGSPNPPYTYPDMNNVFLSAVRASDRAVLIPSYQRINFGGDAANRRHVLRPLPADHAGFPAQADAGGDVKNLAESPGTLIPNTSPPQYANNDSVWLDLGHPVMTAADGRKFKPLFAPLIVDLDGRVNVNIHGNKYGTWNAHAGHPLATRDLFWSTSEHGWGAWEVNPGKVILGQEGPQEFQAEWRRLLLGNSQVPGRYDRNAWFFAVAGGSIHPPPAYWIVGKFYSLTDENCHICGPGNVSLPGTPQLPWGTGWHRSPGASATCAFPSDHTSYSRDNFGGGGESPYPILYNFFDPAGWNYFTAGVRDRRFSVAEMEALLRYSDKGSPALASDLFALCPQSFSDPLNGPKSRWMVTTHSFDIERPGVMPMNWNPAAQAYAMAAGSLRPGAAPVSFPGLSLASPPTGSEYTAQGQAVSALAGRIDINRILPSYANFQNATRARQDLAREIFDVLRMVTGAADPAAVVSGSPEFDALRWLAQLAVNCVDFRDDDDVMTPFNWTGSEWVFGAELPHVVVNEVYAEAANDPDDPLTGGRATLPYKVNFWAELLNPFRRDNFGNLPDGGGARLQDANGKAIYQLVIAETPNNDIRKPSNITGEPDPGKIKTVVARWEPEPAPAPQPTVDATIISPIYTSPTDGGTAGDNGGNRGYYVVGPKPDFPGNDANRPRATLRVRSQQINGQQSSMSYDLPLNNANLAQLPTHTLLLRRLACPGQPHQPNPGQANYNPYVTVDYVEDIATNDGVGNDQNGARQPTQVTQRKSTGRNQPYAAEKSMWNDQNNPASPLQDQPQHTFFRLNYRVVNPFDWLAHIDRQLHNPMELLEVAAFKPHEVTQQFMTGGIDPATGKPRNRFGHLAPWFDESARIYRAMEFLRAGHRLQGVAINGRNLGKVNLNSIWDVEVLRAMADARGSDYFTEADVDAAFHRLRQLRSPDWVPGPRDKPFRGSAASIDPNDPYLRGGLGIEDTYFRSFQDPANPARKLFQPAALPAYANEHTVLKYQMMTKLYQQVTTRSNVFAVFLTVGFFEVVNDSDPNRPPVLGPEIGAAEGRQIRHRMFSVVDRTCLTFDPNDRSKPGPPPFFLDALTAASAGNSTIRLAAVNGNFEEWKFDIRPGDRLVVDVGPKQEIITVASTNLATGTITAAFARAHEGCGIPVTNVGTSTMLGRPEPQPRFDPRNPAYKPVVRYFSIIE